MSPVKWKLAFVCGDWWLLLALLNFDFCHVPRVVPMGWNAGKKKGSLPNTPLVLPTPPIQQRGLLLRVELGLFW